MALREYATERRCLGPDAPILLLKIVVQRTAVALQQLHTARLLFVEHFERVVVNQLEHRLRKHPMQAHEAHTKPSHTSSTSEDSRQHTYTARPQQQQPPVDNSSIHGQRFCPRLAPSL